MRHRDAFTLVELLVVVAILALLVALLAPSLQRAKVLAVRATCGANAKQLRLAAAAYAADNGGRYPHRSPGRYLPHVFWQSGSFDLNKTFAEPYLAGREHILFCPGKLYQVRNPQAPGWQGPGGYGYRYVTYTYYNFQPTFGNWLLTDPFPKMTRTVSASARYPLWACLTVDKHWAYLAHDTPQTPRTPLGMNAAFGDGAARWVPWENMEPFWDDTAQDFYWPAMN